MSGKPECPSTSALESLVQGRLVEPQLSELSVHLEACPACLAQARTLSGHDTMIESLRGEAAGPDRIAREVPRPLVERLKQIPRREAHEWTQACEGRAGEEAFAFLAPPQGPEEIGRLGHYRILKLLGSGGMGAVFLADDPKLERRVALKVMLPKVAANPAARERFLREARAVAKVRSDHVVTVYQVDEADGIPYLTMELLEGQSLDETLRAGVPLSVPRIIAVARDAARGLAAAHEKGLVHRDIKPGNLWLEGEPGCVSTGRFRVKILDFGLAHADTEDVRLTRPGAIVGTPAYMAPEQAYGERAADSRADLFSLGCVLYRLCVGDSPFQSDTMMGTLTALATINPVPPSAQSDSIPTALSELIVQLLEKNPARRPQTAREVVARLNEIERAPAPSKPTRRRRPPVLAALGLLLAAVAVAATVVFRPTPHDKGGFDTPEPPAASPDRRAAEWVLSLGGTVRLNGVDRNVNADELKDDSRLTAVHIQYNPKVTDTGLALFKGCRHLTSLNLAGAPVNAGLAHLKDCVNLTFLSLTNTRLSDDGLAPLKGCTKLTSLHLNGSELGDAGLAHFKDCKELTHLNVDATRITDAALIHLKDCKNLTVLYVSNTRVGDAGMADLTGLTKLKSLFLEGTSVTDAGLASLSPLTGLQQLDVRRTGVTAKGLAVFHAAVPSCKIEYDGGTLKPKR